MTDRMLFEIEAGGRRFALLYEYQGRGGLQCTHDPKCRGRVVMAGRNMQGSVDVSHAWCADHLPKVMSQFMENALEAFTYAYERAVKK